MSTVFNGCSWWPYFGEGDNCFISAEGCKAVIVLWLFNIKIVYIVNICDVPAYPPPQKKEQFGQSKAFRVAEAMHKHKVQHEKLMNSA